MFKKRDCFEKIVSKYKNLSNESEKKRLGLNPYWQNFPKLRNEYEKIISETTDKDHKKKKRSIKNSKPKIKNIAK